MPRSLRSKMVRKTHRIASLTNVWTCVVFSGRSKSREAMLSYLYRGFVSNCFLRYKGERKRKGSERLQRGVREERGGEVEGEKKILEKMWVGDRRVTYLCLAYSLSGLLNLELDVGRIFRILFPLKSCREIGNYWGYSRRLQ